MKNLLSIIVPMYNVETEIEPLAESFSRIDANQFSIAFVFVDDGCTDRTVERLQDFLNLHSKFAEYCQIIHQDNAGMSAARNHGLRNAQGDYVWFIDSDDLINPKYVNTFLLPLLQERRFDFIQLSYSYFQKSIPEDNSVMGSISTCTNQQLFRRLALGQIESFPWAHIFDRSLIQDESFFPEGKAYEDVATTYKLIGNANRVAEVTGTAYYYRKRPGSITRSGYSKHVLDLYSILNELRNNTQVRQGLFTPEAWNLFISRMLMVNYVETLRSEKTDQICDLQPKLRRQIIAMHPTNPPLKYRVKVGLLKFHLLGIVFKIKDRL